MQRLLLLVCALAFALACGPRAAGGQTGPTQLRLHVQGPAGSAISADVVVTGADGKVMTRKTDASGDVKISELPPGRYSVQVSSSGLAAQTLQVALSPGSPVAETVQLRVAAMHTRVDVRADVLLDTQQPSAVSTVSERQISEEQTVQPGRRLLDLVNDQPGWLFEQNGVLHPRESEYDVQFVVDGLPITDNQSPAFSPGIDSDDVTGLQIRTAGFAAEYGRSLGGVVDVRTQQNAPRGWHGNAAMDGGSFNTVAGAATVSYAAAKAETLLSAQGSTGNRYLDPPVLENYTNNAVRQSVRVQQDWKPDEDDSWRFFFTQGHVDNQVPNDLPQQQHGQRQSTTLSQTSLAASWQHSVSDAAVLQAKSEFRDLSVSLESNALATPIIIAQTRGFREGYLGTSLAWHAGSGWGMNDVKAGVDTLARSVHETLSYVITDPSQFDPGTALTFAFSDRRWDVEPGFYLQDTVHAAGWNIAAGARYDVYRFVLHQSAASPRLSVSRYFPLTGTLLHASYDRVFQTPAVANLLLASSPEVQSLSTFVQRLPVQPARANYYEVGLAKVFGDIVRLDATVFRRDFRNYPDDDTLLSTGISFPIADAFARIAGEELSLQLRNWRRFSGFANYANQTGTARGSITGGLFLGDSGAEELATTGTFAVSQDQRNTLRSQLRYSLGARAWVSAEYSYNSGLPAELPDVINIPQLQQQYGAAIVDQVDFIRGRVHPGRSLDTAAGITLFSRNEREAALQFQLVNATDHINVINFASLFSGTGVGLPRSASVRLRLNF